MMRRELRAGTARLNGRARFTPRRFIWFCCDSGVNASEQRRWLHANPRSGLRHARRGDQSILAAPTVSVGVISVSSYGDEGLSPANGFAPTVGAGDGVVDVMIAGCDAAAWEWHPATEIALTSASSVARPVMRIPLSLGSRAIFICISTPADMASEAQMVCCTGTERHPSNAGP